MRTKISYYKTENSFQSAQIGAKNARARPTHTRFSNARRAGKSLGRGARMT